MFVLSKLSHSEKNIEIVKTFNSRKETEVAIKEQFATLSDKEYDKETINSVDLSIDNIVPVCKKVSGYIYGTYEPTVEYYFVIQELPIIVDEEKEFKTKLAYNAMVEKTNIELNAYKEKYQKTLRESDSISERITTRLNRHIKELESEKKLLGHRINRLEIEKLENEDITRRLSDNFTEQLMRNSELELTLESERSSRGSFNTIINEIKQNQKKRGDQEVPDYNPHPNTESHDTLMSEIKTKSTNSFWGKIKDEMPMEMEIKITKDQRKGDKEEDEFLRDMNEYIENRKKELNEKSECTTFFKVVDFKKNKDKDEPVFNFKFSPGIKHERFPKYRNPAVRNPKHRKPAPTSFCN